MKSSYTTRWDTIHSFPKWGMDREKRGRFGGELVGNHIQLFQSF